MTEDCYELLSLLAYITRSRTKTVPIITRPECLVAQGSEITRSSLATKAYSCFGLCVCVSFVSISKTKIQFVVHVILQELGFVFDDSKLGIIHYTYTYIMFDYNFYIIILSH